MAWIKTISTKEASGELARLYTRIKGPDGRIDNILVCHSLRPHTLKGHMALYKNVLHHKGNTLPKWLLEAIGVYVSLLNHCDYCVLHHFEGLKRLLDDKSRSASLLEALEHDSPADHFQGRELCIMEYARKLTRQPSDVTSGDITKLREHGLSDGEILEVNQVTAYFAYANRTVLGLGVDTTGDVLGLSPNDSDSEDNWSHQ